MKILLKFFYFSLFFVFLTIRIHPQNSPKQKDFINIYFFSWHLFKIGDSYSNVMEKVAKINWLDKKENVEEEMFGKKSLNVRFYPNDYIRSLSFQFQEEINEKSNEKKKINEETIEIKKISPSKKNIYLKGIRVVYAEKFFSYNDIYQKLKKKYDNVTNISKIINFDRVKWQNKQNILTFYRKDNLIIIKKKDQNSSPILKMNSDRGKILNFF